MTARPFIQALQHLGGKTVMPTRLGSAELSALDAGVRRQSLFSARTVLKDYLTEIQQTVESVINPIQVKRTDENGVERYVTEGFNPATARENLRQTLRALSYSPEAGTEGTIRDISSDARINLVVKTNVELAQGAGHFIQQNDPETVDAFPALELYRLEERRDPRDWPMRWRIAAQVAGDAAAARVQEFTGRFVALKSSGIWQALGDGAGGYLDTLGNPYPPFAFNSGMWTEEVERASAEALGLLPEGQAASSAPLDIASLFTSEEVAA